MFSQLLWAATIVPCSALPIWAQQFSLAPNDTTTNVGDVQRHIVSDSLVAVVAPATVASCNLCSGFSLSNDNIYFTAYDSNEFGPDRVSLSRSSKTGPTGSEVLLHEETFLAPASFGTPVQANGSSYFAATSTIVWTQVYQIKRVPNPGGIAYVHAVLPGPINSLATDGANLFWADSSGIRSLSVSGGPIQNVWSIHGSARFAIRLHENYVYFSFGREIRRVPKSGGQSTIVIAAPDEITSFSVYGASSPTLYWAEQSGTVKSAGPSGIQVIQPQLGRRSVRSVSFDGRRVLWSECAYPGESSCSIKTKVGAGAVTTVYTGAAVAGLVSDSAALYWTDYSSIKRLAQ